MRVLLTNRELVNIGGSELVTVEIAETLECMGFDVVIYSPHIGGGPLELKHLNVTDKRPDTKGFDVLWIHHNILIHDLGFKKRLSQRIIFNHMSSYVPQEWPKIAGYEMALADKILANSHETREVLLARGLTEVELFQNPAPAWFEVVRGGGDRPFLISNHPPAELNAIEGVRIGGPNGGLGQTRIRPYHLSQARYVICNGKTVQYALRAGVPVYLYDHFGGPGWLTPENFERAEWYNFSGRGFGKKTAEEIFRELESVPAALACPDRFKLEKRLEELL